jgi:DnaJ-class molecular chaperone
MLISTTVTAFTEPAKKPARMWCGDSFGYATINIRADEEVCATCEGLGANWNNHGVGGSEKWSRDCCETCDGNGVLKIEEAE